jgi:acyl-CoA thioesterase-2
MNEEPLDLSRVFELEPHGPDTFLGESPPYPWGRIYGGLVVAQGLWAATQTVKPEHGVHSLHAYFILGGDPAEPVRYEVDRIRNGRSFTTRRVVARQSGGAILSLACSFQREEGGTNTQSATLSAEIPRPQDLAAHWDAGAERCDVDLEGAPPRSVAWGRFPLPLGDDLRLHACAIAYLSDMNAMGAIRTSHPQGVGKTWEHFATTASLDHAMWFHRPARADQWLLIDMSAHGVAGMRGLATGLVFREDGVHAASIAQEGLVRERGPRPPEA